MTFTPKQTTWAEKDGGHFRLEPISSGGYHVHYTAPGAQGSHCIGGIRRHSPLCNNRSWAAYHLGAFVEFARTRKQAAHLILCEYQELQAAMKGGVR